MKIQQETLPWRDGLGGLLGGLIGILSTWYMPAWTLPFGTLIGATVGWYHRHLGSFLSETWRLASAEGRGQLSNLRKQANSYALTTREFAGQVGNFIREMPGKLWRGFVRQLTDFHKLIMTVPRRCQEWFDEHPYNRVRFVGIMAGTLLIVVFLIGAYTMATYYVPDDPRGDARAFGIIVACLSLAGGFAAYKERLGAYPNRKLKELNQFYREWEIFSRYGSAGFFFYILGQYARYVLGATVFLAVVVPWGLTLGVVLMLVGFLIMPPTVLLLKAYFMTARRHGLLLCAGTTLVVTTAMYFFYHGAMTNARAAWALALVTGVICGAASNLLRKMVFLLEKRSGLVEYFEKSVEDILLEDYSKVAFGFSVIWFGHNRPARMLRAVCFSTPVERKNFRPATF